MATMQQVADRAGVSIATVSFVVNGTKYVTPGTTARVKTAMRELKFRGNVVARALASRRTRIIALLFPTTGNRFSPTTSQFFMSAAKRASERGYHLVLWPVDPAGDDVETGDRGPERAAWPGQDGPDRSVLHDPAVLEHDDAVGEEQHVENVVGDDQRGPVGQHTAEHLAHGGGGGDVECGQGFVQQEEPGIGRQRPGDCDALGLAAGQRRRPTVGQVGGVHLRQPSPGHLA